MQRRETPCLLSLSLSLSLSSLSLCVCVAVKDMAARAPRGHTLPKVFKFPIKLRTSYHCNKLGKSQ